MNATSARSPCTTPAQVQFTAQHQRCCVRALSDAPRPASTAWAPEMAPVRTTRHRVEEALARTVGSDATELDTRVEFLTRSDRPHQAVRARPGPVKRGSMCGICGEIQFEVAGSASPIDVAAVDRMTAAMDMRGPDGGGIVARKRVAFGHRRLRIIDLSEHGEQPMVDASLGLTIVFNGAIYNYSELRAELEGHGHRFFSHGDTEVILKAYAAWGERCVERLNGMFAFAIWERDSGRVFLARDRLGIKPLYLAPLKQGLRFASSIPRCLRPAASIPRSTLSACITT